MSKSKIKNLGIIYGKELLEYIKVHFVYYDNVTQSGYYLYAPYVDDISNTTTEELWKYLAEKSYLGENLEDAMKIIDKYYFENGIDKYNL